MWLRRVQERRSPYARVRVQATERVARGRGLEPIMLHEARHTFASMMIAAGVSAKVLSTYIGGGRSDHERALWSPGAGQRGGAAGLADAYLSATC